MNIRIQILITSVLLTVTTVLVTLLVGHVRGHKLRIESLEKEVQELKNPKGKMKLDPAIGPIEDGVEVQ